MKPIVRLAEPRDYDAVERIMKEVHALHVAWRPDIYSVADPVMSREEFTSIIERNGMLVADERGEVLGLVSFFRRHVGSERQCARNVFFISDMAVLESWRGNGIGRMLFDQVKKMARDSGMDAVELQVNARNAMARNMYEKYGFTEKSVNMELPL